MSKVWSLNAWPQGHSHFKVKGHTSLFNTDPIALNRFSPSMELCRAWLCSVTLAQAFHARLVVKVTPRSKVMAVCRRCAYHSIHFHQTCLDTCDDRVNSSYALTFKVTTKVKGKSIFVFPGLTGNIYGKMTVACQASIPPFVSPTLRLQPYRGEFQTYLYQIWYENVLRLWAFIVC